jgi:hypothetical protein
LLPFFQRADVFAAEAFQRFGAENLLEHLTAYEGQQYGAQENQDEFGLEFHLWINQEFAVLAPCLPVDAIRADPLTQFRNLAQMFVWFAMLGQLIGRNQPDFTETGAFFPWK